MADEINNLQQMMEETGAVLKEPPVYTKAQQEKLDRETAAKVALKLEKESALQVIEAFVEWLADDGDQYLTRQFLKEFGLPVDYFIKTTKKFQEDDEVVEAFGRGHAIQAEKIVSLAQRHKIDVSMAIFHLKAKFGWKDGREVTAAGNTLSIGTINMLNLKGPELDGYISKLQKDLETLTPLDKLKEREDDFKLPGR